VRNEEVDIKGEVCTGVLSICPTLSDFPTVAQNYSHIYRFILPRLKILLSVSASRL